MTNTNEIKKVDHEEFCKARNEMMAELNKLSTELFGTRGNRYVEIYTDYGFGSPIESVVNWAAIGSVPAEDAVKFAKLLTKAADLASNFKYNGYKVYYTDED